eukprot:UC4_evm1s1151
MARQKQCGRKKKSNQVALPAITSAKKRPKKVQQKGRANRRPQYKGSRGLRGFSYSPTGALYEPTHIGERKRRAQIHQGHLRRHRLLHADLATLSGEDLKEAKALREDKQKKAQKKMENKKNWAAKQKREKRLLQVLQTDPATLSAEDLEEAKNLFEAKQMRVEKKKQKEEKRKEANKRRQEKNKLKKEAAEKDNKRSRDTDPAIVSDEGQEENKRLR